MHHREKHPKARNQGAPRRVPLVFFLTPQERRMIVRALRRQNHDRARALLDILGLLRS